MRASSWLLLAVVSAGLTLVLAGGYLFATGFTSEQSSMADQVESTHLDVQPDVEDHAYEPPIPEGQIFSEEMPDEAADSEQNELEVESGPETESESQEQADFEALETASNPVRIALPILGVEAEIDLRGPSFGSNRFNPVAGRIDFWLESDTSRPCEAGPSFMLGHVTDVFARLTTGPGDDHRDGVETGDRVVVTLEDGTECIFEVVDFDLEIGEPVEGTPAHRIGKNDWAQTYWEEAIQSSGERPVLFLLTSSGTEFEPSGHRVHNDIVLAELTDIRTPAG